MFSGSAAHERQSDFAVTLANEQSRHIVDESRLLAAAQAVLGESPFSSANVSLAVVDDATMRELNRRYLDHDWPTDVLSFVLDERDGHLEGEVIISADTAAATAAEIDSSAAAEQLLYIIHGALHLVGYRDKTAADAAAMRAAEAGYLRQFGFEPLPGHACPRAAEGIGANHPGDGALPQ